MITYKGKNFILSQCWLNSNSPLEYIGLSSTLPNIDGTSGTTEPNSPEYVRIATKKGGNDNYGYGSGSSYVKVWEIVPDSNNSTIQNSSRLVFEETQADYGWQKYLVMFTAQALSTKTFNSYSPILVPTLTVGGIDLSEGVTFKYAANDSQYEFIQNINDSDEQNMAGIYTYTYASGTWTLAYAGPAEGTDYAPTFNGTTAQLESEQGIRLTLPENTELTDGDTLRVEFGIHPLAHTLPIIRKNGVKISIL